MDVYPGDEAMAEYMADMSNPNGLNPLFPDEDGYYDFEECSASLAQKAFLEHMRKKGLDEDALESMMGGKANQDLVSVRSCIEHIFFPSRERERERERAKKRGDSFVCYAYFPLPRRPNRRASVRVSVRASVGSHRAGTVNKNVF